MDLSSNDINNLIMKHKILLELTAITDLSDTSEYQLIRKVLIKQQIFETHK